MTWIGIFFGSLVAQIYRYFRNSTRPERQQIKWIVLLLAIAAVAIPVYLLYGWIVQSNPTGPKVLLLDFIDHSIGLILGVGVPLVFVLAIFYQRLWDIDVIIRRTLVYTTLTAILALFYFASVLLLQAILRPLTGSAEQPPVVIVLSTLSIAALFTPLRRRIQDAIDRRFYRRKYDAERTLQAFAASLRSELDLDELRSQLLAVVQETMQPESVSLWLGGTGKRPAYGDQKQMTFR
jgi:hypothetical protein